MPDYQKLSLFTKPIYHSVCFAFTSSAKASFEKCVQLINVEPTQIIRPGDRNPNTGRLFRDNYTGKPLEKSSWIIDETKSGLEARNLNTSITSIGEKLSPYSETIAEIVVQGGSSSFDVAWAVPLNYTKLIKGPLITKETWKLMHRFKSGLGFAFYESSGDDENDVTVDDKDCFEHSFVDIQINDTSLFKIEQNSLRDGEDGLHTILHECEDIIENNITNFLDLLKEEKSDLDIVIHKRTDYFSDGIIFSPTLVSYFSQLNANVFFLDSSLCITE